MDWRQELRDRVDAARFPAPQGRYSVDPVPAQIARQRAMFWFALQQEPEFLVTIKFNDSLDDLQIQKRLRLFDAMLDRFFLGKRWAGFPSETRTFFIAFVERDRTSSGSHVHMLLRRPCNPKAEPMPPWKEPVFLSSWFTRLGRGKGVCPRGDIKFQLFAREDDQEQATSYALKDQDNDDGWNPQAGFILSSEFHV
jgi:hypothetical protein